MAIRPLGDRVLVKRVEEEEMTKGGLYIPDTAKEKPIEGKVVAPAGMGSGALPVRGMGGNAGPGQGGQLFGGGAKDTRRKNGCWPYN